jgi:GLPGLI family protein
MMKHILYACIALFGVIAQAQDFQGMAVYESKTSMSDFKPPSNRDITPEMQKQMQERMKKAMEKTYILHFDKAASTYEEEQKLDAPGDNGGFRMMANFMGGGKHYKNIKDKRFTQAKEVFGKEFLVDDSLPKINWKLENETRKVGDYTCYKATAEVAASKSDFRNFRRKKDADDKKTDAAAAAKTEDKKPTSFMDQVEMPKTVTITAWYTPQVPVSQGPENYWGLPGLILEVSDGKTTILCSKLVINPKEKAEIKKPTTGKKVTQAEFDDIVVKKMEEMRQMGGPGGPGGGRMGGGGGRP